MALNPFFLQGSITEQGLIQDLINEQLKMYGVDVYYIPREYVNEKTIMKEVIESDFRGAFPIEAYVDTYDGYNGAGTILSKFGVQELDDVNLIISQERYETYLKPLIQNLPNVKLSSRPKEGDLIYFPLGDRLFEIKYVEHEKPFYQLKKNYVYELRCELFRYNNEIIDTEIEFIDDNVEFEGYTQTLKLVGVGSLPTAYCGLVNNGVRYITITNRGKGYKSTPKVAISSSPEPNGSAVGFATMISGLLDLCEPNSSLLRIQGVELVKTGYGYTTPPSVSFIGGGGKGASATAVLGNGIVGIVTVTNGGFGYVNPPVVTFAAPGAASTATVSFIGNINDSGFVTSISISNQQGFFAVSDTFNFPAPILTNAQISGTLNNTSLNLSISNPGAGYTVTAVNTIKFTGGGLTTSHYKFGSSSLHLTGNDSDIISYQSGSDIFRDGRVDFFIKIKNTSNPGTLIVSKGLYGSTEWQIDLNSNLNLEFIILNGLETFEVPTNINDGQWHFVSIQKTQNPYTAFNTLIVVDGNVYELTGGEPNLYLASEGILIKSSVNTDCYIDNFRIENSCINYDNSIPSTPFSSTTNTIFLYDCEHASVTPTISNGKVSSLVINSSGSGYSSVPSIIVSPPSRLITAQGKTVVNNEGLITSVTITNPGFGYSSSPTVGIAASFSQKQTAIGRAHINSSGIITSVTLINAGVGYTQPPAITFSSPPTTGIGTYIFNETVIGSASSTRARVKSWNAVTREIVLYNINGNFLSGEYLNGQTSSASYKINIINTDNLQDPYAQNDEIQAEANEIIDFSEKNPFGKV